MAQQKEIGISQESELPEAQSFPDLLEPEKLTDEAFMAASTALIQSMNLK